MCKEGITDVMRRNGGMWRSRCTNSSLRDTEGGGSSNFSSPTQTCFLSLVV